MGKWGHVLNFQSTQCYKAGHLKLLNLSIMFI